MSSALFDRIRSGLTRIDRLARSGHLARSERLGRPSVARFPGHFDAQALLRHAATFSTVGAVVALAGCAVQPVPGQSSIISRLPADYAYSAPVDTQPVQTQALPQAQPQPKLQSQAQSMQPAPADTAALADVPPMSDQERQRYADIDRQVQRDQTQAMAAEQAARAAWYYPSYGYPAYYPGYYPSYYPAYTPAYYPYYASPVVVGGYYGGGWGRGGWGRGGCCYHGGSRWSVGVGFSSGGWAW